MKNGRIKELVFANVCWNVAEQTITLTKKSLHAISLYQKIIWLKFLFTDLLKAKK